MFADLRQPIAQSQQHKAAQNCAKYDNGAWRGQLMSPPRPSPRWWLRSEKTIDRELVGIRASSEGSLHIALLLHKGLLSGGTSQDFIGGRETLSLEQLTPKAQPPTRLSGRWPEVISHLLSCSLSIARDQDRTICLGPFYVMPSTQGYDVMF